MPCCHLANVFETAARMELVHFRRQNHDCIMSTMESLCAKKLDIRAVLTIIYVFPTLFPYPSSAVQNGS